MTWRGSPTTPAGGVSGPLNSARIGALRIAPRRGASGRRRDRETRAVVPAGLEHVCRFSRHSVRIRAAERRRQPDFPDSRRGPAGHPDTMGGGAALRAHRSADHRLRLRSHLDATRTAAAVFSRRRAAHDTGACLDAQLFHTVGGGSYVVSDGCLHQRFHGAFPGVRRRPAAGVAAATGVRAAELLHRRRRGTGLDIAVGTGEARRRERCAGWTDSGDRAHRLLRRRGGAVLRCAMDGGDHSRVRARATAELRTQRPAGRAHGRLQSMAARYLHVGGGGSRGLALSGGSRSRTSSISWWVD